MIYKKFRINQLFSITPSNTYGSTIKDSSIISEEGTTPYISNTITNNGLAGYSILQANNKGNAITLSDTVTSVYDTIYYQKKDFIGKSHLQVLRPLIIENSEDSAQELFVLTERVALYIITCMKKSVKTGEFDYGTKFNRDAISETIISLPVYNEDDLLPAFDYMDSYIKKIIPQYFNILDGQIDDLRKKNDKYKLKIQSVMDALAK